MKLDRQTLMMMTAAAGAALTMSLSAGPAEQTEEADAGKAKDPLALAPCMVDVDGEEVCTKKLTWSELSDEEKAALTAAIAAHRKAEAVRIAEAKAETEKAAAEEAAKPVTAKPVTQPVWGKGDPCYACGMG